MDPAGERPARQGWQPVGTECCVDEGRPRPRSVHRERVGRVIEPRKVSYCGSRRSANHGRQHRCAAKPGTAVPPGSESGACTQGSTRNLGDLVSSTVNTGRGNRLTNPRPVRRRARATGETQIERNGGTAERRRRSDAGREARSRSPSILPGKQGNAPYGPCGGKRGVRLRNCWRER
jgi:hypothetical protein